MTEIKWQAPPAPKHKRGSAQEFADALKERPGEWALYGRMTSSAANYLKQRYGLQVTSRNRGGGDADIYARWIGEK